MDELRCPRCGEPLHEANPPQVRVWRCDQHPDGVYLDRAQLGALIEAELDWHANAVHNTTAMPRITPDMEPPPAPPPRARAWVETLFSDR
jgi:Zn-finger nucleic acid-binding protein